MNSETTSATSDDSLDKRIKETEEDLRQAEVAFGCESPIVAEDLEALAALLKANNVRLLDAANLLSRAAAIRKALAAADGSALLQEMKNTRLTSTSDNHGQKECPFCAELVKMEAIVCRFCNRDLPKRSVTGPKTAVHKPGEINPGIALLIVAGLVCFILCTIKDCLSQSSSSESVAPGMFLLLIIMALYFVPTIVAANKKRKNAIAIGALNLFAGWTFIGWVIALVWAMTE